MGSIKRLRAASAAFVRLLGLGAMFFVAPNACSISPNLANLPCPCAAGFICDTERDRCIADCGECGACTTCTERGCEAAEDGTTCDEGRCYEGGCCDGCWDGVACQAGESLNVCGNNGARCEGCSCDGDTCTAGSCAPARQAVHLSAGHEHTCAALDDSNLWCWGAFDSGELGRAAASALPGLVTTMVPGWKASAGGARHTCGLQFDKEILCWGDNARAQLGQPLATLGSTTPLPLASGPMPGRWISLTAGDTHSCAIDDAFDLWCWGNNGSSGALGGGCADEATPVPRSVGGGDWQSLDAYRRHTCALKEDGSLWCWGSNIDGALGVGDFDDRCSPVAVGDARWQSLGIGAFHSCAISDEQSVSCWGGNQQGQLGRGYVGMGDKQTVPLAIEGSYKHLAGGASHACALDLADELHCWGHNARGQLGISGTTDAARPQPIDAGHRWRQLALGNGHTCGIRLSGTVHCWGASDLGQTGHGPNTTDDELPTRVCLQPAR